MIKKQTHQFGILAERVSILFLRLKGYKILKWRYKSHFGEIDIKEWKHFEKRVYWNDKKVTFIQ